MSAPADMEVEWLRAKMLPQIIAGRQFAAENGDVANAADTFKLHNVQIKFIGVEEAFMLTTCYRAVVEYEYAGVRGTRSLIIKKTPNVPQEMFDSISFAALFGNEINTYKTIMPAIEKFAGHKFNIPKFYYGELQPGFATIALEDFGAGGWRVTKERVNLSLEHVLIAVKYLADFHGVCFALRQQQRERFDALTSLLQESRYGNSVIHPDYKLLMHTSVNRLLKVTREQLPQVQAEFQQRFSKLLSDPFRYAKQLVQPVEPMVTLCHGDFLRNNVAYRYGKGEDDDKPQAIMMFDLQTMRVSSPMLDLTIFLQLSAYAAVRYKHFAKIFSTYCQQLAGVYEKLTGSALPDYLSEESLLKEYTRFLPYAISVAAGFLPSLVAPKNMTSEEMLLEVRTEEDIIEEAMTLGGATVDNELAHMMKELHELSLTHDVDVFAGFDV